MKIAVIGSRDFKDRDEAFSIIYNMFDPTCREQLPHLVSGGARGIDSLAEEVVNYLNELYEVNIQKTIFKPDWDKHGKSAGFIRNKLIIDEADFIVAIWNAKSKGTKHSIDLAIKANKPIDIYIRP